MRDEEIIMFVVLAIAIVLVTIVGIALIAGGIVNQFFASFPSIGGPLGAVAALLVFLFLAGKIVDVVIHGFG